MDVTRTALALALLAAAVAAALPLAAGVPESAAPSVQGVEATWHTPDPLSAHTQWSGFLRLAPSLAANTTSATFQVCRVGSACFAPPAAATRIDERTFRFDTASYLANGAPVDFQPGWALGVRWIVNTTAGASALPPATPCPPQEACPEDGYFTFAVAGSGPKATPFAGWLPFGALVVALAALALRGRHG